MIPIPASKMWMKIVEQGRADGMPLQASSRWTSILSSMFFGHSGSAINLPSCPHLPLPNALLKLCCLWHSPIFSSLQWAAGLAHLSSLLLPRCSRLNYWPQFPPSLHSHPCHNLMSRVQCTPFILILVI